MCMQDSNSIQSEEPVFPQKIAAGKLNDMSEDSLHLTVYTTTTETKNMPVGYTYILFHSVWTFANERT